MSEILKLGDVAIGLSGGNFTGVAHDGTLSGNGLTSSPLGVIGGGGDTSQCLPKSASGDFILTSQSGVFITSTAGCQPSGNYQTAGDYAYNSALSSKLDASASGDFITSTAGLQPAGNYQTAGDYAYNSSLSSYQPSGDYAFNSSLSGYLPASASGDFITSTAGLQPSGDYAFNSALSSYLPKSASGDFAPSGDYAHNSALSAYAYESSVSAWTAKQDALTFGYSGSYISSINGSAIADTTAGGGGTTYTGISPINVNNTANTISLQSTAVSIDNTLRTYQSGLSSFVGLAYPTVVVSNSSQATGTDIIYIVTGE